MYALFLHFHRCSSLKAGKGGKAGPADEIEEVDENDSGLINGVLRDAIM